MIDVRTVILIDKSIAIVATYAANPDNAPEWYVNIKSAEWQTAKPLQVGSRISFVAHFLGRKLSYTYEVTELLPGKKLVMQTAEGPFPMETTYTWRAVNESTTRMTLQNRGMPTGFSKWMTPMMAAMMKRANKKDLQSIKRILERK